MSEGRMATVARALQILHPLGTMTVLVGLAFNALDIAEVISIDRLAGDAAQVVRVAPLLLGAAVVLAAFMWAPEGG